MSKLEGKVNEYLKKILRFQILINAFNIHKVA
jgi:hypothetical protein